MPALWGAVVIVSRVSLPVPPSVNNLFLNLPGKGRVKSKAYKAWIAHAGTLLMIARFPRFDDKPVSIEINVPPKARSDIDNLAKGPLDLLTLHGIINDDSQVSELIIRRYSEPDLLLSITPYTG